jgi:hypothetical protein
LSHFISSLCIGYFWHRVLLYTQVGLDDDALICASPCSCNNRHMPLCPAIGWEWSLMICKPRLALNHNPLDLSLSSSYCYRLKPLHPNWKFSFRWI